MPNSFVEATINKGGELFDLMKPYTSLIFEVYDGEPAAHLEELFSELLPDVLLIRMDIGTLPNPDQYFMLQVGQFDHEVPEIAVHIKSGLYETPFFSYDQ